MEGSVRKRKRREGVACVVREQLWFLGLFSPSVHPGAAAQQAERMKWGSVWMGSGGYWSSDSEY